MLYAKKHFQLHQIFKLLSCAFAKCAILAVSEFALQLPRTSMTKVTKLNYFFGEVIVQQLLIFSPVY
jgi:hypothetical protein